MVYIKFRENCFLTQCFSFLFLFFLRGTGCVGVFSVGGHWPISIFGAQTQTFYDDIIRWCYFCYFIPKLIVFSVFVAFFFVVVVVLFFRLVICLFRWPDFGLHMMCGTWFASFAIPYHLHLRYLAYRMALIFTVSKNSSSLFLLREDKWTMGKFTTFIQTGKTHLKAHTYSQRGLHHVILSGHTNLSQWRTGG